MILNIKQTRTGYNMEWQVLNNNQLYCNVVSPLETNSFCANITYCNGEFVSVVYNPHDNSHGSRIIDKYGMYIYQNNDCIGSMKTAVCKTGKFLGSYIYTEIIYGDEKLNVYNVGMGKEGFFICYYYNDSLVAIVKKEIRTVNYQDVYTAFIEDERYVKFVIPMVIDVDITLYGNIGEVSVRNVETEITVTPQKELRAKFDPDFIERIKRRDGNENQVVKE